MENQNEIQKPDSYTSFENGEQKVIESESEVVETEVETEVVETEKTEEEAPAPALVPSESPEQGI